MTKAKFKKWIKKTGIKAVKTMAETALGVIGSNAIGVTDVNWIGVASASLLAGITTVLIYIKEIKEEK